MKRTRDSDAYRRLTNALRRQRRGVTAADMVAGTALPLETVRELLPRASDEYRGRLEVTESGEILYSFPHGFISRYRSLPVRLQQIGGKFLRGLEKAGAAVFKVWIMVMLVGYFLLFMLIALAALMLSVVSVSGSNSNGRARRNGDGGMYFAGNILNLIIRLWFYSELFKPRYASSPVRPKGKPLHKAVFSFVFGDGDPNAGWPVREQKAVITYIQANRGVISLPEFMALTGLKPEQAESEITAYCVRFGGLPEATGEGTVVYRFDPLMLKTDVQTGRPGSTLKELWNFSSNSPGMNRAFVLINGINLAFGSYFLYFTLNLKRLVLSGWEPGFWLFAKAYSFFYRLLGASSPWDIQVPFAVVLGLVPLAFSIFFWLIPALRRGIMERNNTNIKLENFRKTAYSRIWDEPQNVKAEDFNPAVEKCCPRNLPAARDRIIKEIGAYAVPEVSIDGRGDTVYTFTGLKQEREALDSYRSALDSASPGLGKTVFDSGS